MRPACPPWLPCRLPIGAEFASIAGTMPASAPSRTERAGVRALDLEQTDSAPAEPEAGTETPAPTSTSTSTWGSRLTIPLATFVLVAIFSSVVVGVGVSRHHQLFVLDEGTY